MLAPTCLYVHDLLQLFQEALVLEDVSGHLCCVADEEGRLLPLIGDALHLLDEGPARDALDFPVACADGSTLVVRLAARAPLERHRRSRLHLLATLYALHVLPLLEASEDDLRARATPTPREQDCLGLTASGLSGLDIGERVDLSVPAVGILLRRAAQRPGAGSIAEAAKAAPERARITR